MKLTVMRPAMSAIAFAAALWAQPATAGAETGPERPRLMTDAGTFLLRGSLGISVVHQGSDLPAGGFGFGTGGASSSLTGVSLGANATAGFFAVRNLFVGLNAVVSASYGDFDTLPKQVSVAALAEYLFNWGSIVVPHVGAALGPYFFVPPRGDMVKGLTIGVPAGVYIAVGRHVAIDVGVSVTVLLDLSSPAKTVTVTAPIGFLGVAAFI